MSRPNRGRGARRVSPVFGLEPLEKRELMAADLSQRVESLAPSGSPVLGPLPPPPLAASSMGVMGTGSFQLAGEAGVPTPIAAALVRSFDGTGNNLANPEWGSVGEQLLRMAEAQYGDGVSSLAGESRPSPREISNALAAQDPEHEGNDRGMSAFVYLWGQFIDHDIDLTDTQGSGGEAAPIEVPLGDPLFDPDGTGAMTIPFTRSEYDPATGVDDPRQQITEITSWIDGSQVYGSDQATADSLRTFVGGRLRTGDGGLLPMENGVFLAGDVRVNENIELSAIHALFVREHNQWADRIAAENPGLSDEQIYQRARAIVVAEIQAITYNEFLPALLGAGALARYHGYDATVDPSIANEFSTAAFRLGHSLVNEEIEFFGDDGLPVRDAVSLREAFFNPTLLAETGIDGIMKYVASSQSMEVDLQIVDSLRNFLFGEPGQGGLDLASLNIQRGRDHGLADYNSVRAAYGLPRVTSFAEITSDVEVQQQLAALYGSVDDVDLWVGALAEDHVPGGSVGELTRAIIADQFARLRDGDRLWYQNVFHGRDLAIIEQTSLADVIARNTNVRNLQDDVFFMNATVSGTVTGPTAGAKGPGTQRLQPLAGVAVELLNEDGEVIDATTTDRSGRYVFATFRETGEYAIRVTLPGRSGQPLVQTVDVAISRGGLQLAGMDFAFGKPGASQKAAQPGMQTPRPHQMQPGPLDAVDQAFAEGGSHDLRRLAGLDAPGKAKRRK